MITTEGKAQIKRYLAGYVPYIAGSITLGIGSRTEALLDKYPQFEAIRINTNALTYNFAINKLIFKASIPPEFAGRIYEIGLYSSTAEIVNSAYGSRLLSSFDSIKEDWRNLSTGLPVAYSSTNARIGNDSLLQTPLASATQEDYLRNLNFDLSRNLASDVFSFAFTVVNTNTSSVRFRFMTDASNYYDFTFGAGTVDSIGYKIVTATKSTAVVTGAPNWGKITEVRVSTTSKSSGQSDVELDGIRIDALNTYGLDNILVARKVLATPFSTLVGQPQDVEYSLDISI